VLWRLISAREAKRHVHAQGPVCGSSAQQLDGICGVVELLCQVDDELGYLAAAEQASNAACPLSLARRSSCAMA
jgi:hypothetical protein